MMSPISGRMASNPVSSLSQKGPLGDAKAAAKPMGAPAEEAAQDPLAEMEKLIQMLLEQLKRAGMLPPGAEMGAPAGGGGGGGGGGGAPAAARAAGGGGGGGGGGGAPAAAAGGAPAMAPYNLGGAGGANIEGIQVSDPQLAQALTQIASHPDGAKLLEAAKANGLSSISANPGLNPGGGAGTEGLYQPGNNSIEIANPNSPNLIQTLVHELGHAATKGNGNSQAEEQTVHALGERIQADLTGRGSTFQLDLGSYSDLAGDNGIANSLRGLGIRV